MFLVRGSSHSFGLCLNDSEYYFKLNLTWIRLKISNASTTEKYQNTKEEYKMKMDKIKKNLNWKWILKIIGANDKNIQAWHRLQTETVAVSQQMKKYSPLNW